MIYKERRGGEKKEIMSKFSVAPAMVNPNVNDRKIKGRKHSGFSEFLSQLQNKFKINIYL